MIVQNTNITLEWILEKNALNVYNSAYFDMQITSPSNIVTYLEGSSNWATTFLQPTPTVNGLITYDTTFTELGVYVIILGTGISASFVILDTSLAMVVEQDSTLNNKVILP